MLRNMPRYVPYTLVMFCLYNAMTVDKKKDLNPDIRHMEHILLQNK